METLPPNRHRATVGDASAEGNTCRALLAADPGAAADYARDWAHRGGGNAARRCAALSDVALGDAAGGAAMLDALAGQEPQPEQRALLADEAAQAWLEASQPDRALLSAGLAVSLVPLDPVLLADHGRAALAAGHPEQAVADLSHVLATHPGRAELLVLRAGAYRRLDRLDAARSDIDAACAAVPDAPDALLERGILRERAGDLDGARTDWDRVLSVSPDTHEADLAQQDLALLDAGPEAR